MTISEVRAYNAQYPFEDVGHWTPGIAGAGTAGDHTYQRRIGSFMRQGQVAHISFDVQYASFDSNASGSAIITGIPFLPFNAGDNVSAIGIVAGWGSLPGAYAGGVIMNIQANGNGQLRYYNTQGTTSAVAIGDLGTNSTRIRGSVQYRIAS